MMPRGSGEFVVRKWYPKLAREGFPEELERVFVKSKQE
jgi:hypothetical protein